MTAQAQSILADMSIARNAMIESQIRPNKVKDEAILAAMAQIPRELFVPPQMSGVAYIDNDIEIVPGRFLMQPMIFARLLQEAAITQEDRVLDIACGSGYSAAVLGLIAKEVIAVEFEPGLRRWAEKAIADIAVENVQIVRAYPHQGYPEAAPYDAIIVNGMVDAVPEGLLAQLREGGRLVAVFSRDGGGMQTGLGEARLVQKLHGGYSTRALFDASISIAPGFQSEPIFRF